MINSRRLEDLLPVVQLKVASFLYQCQHTHGLSVILTSTHRDVKYQNWLYEQGRSRPGNIVTNARGGKSWHHLKVAADFAVLHGKSFAPDDSPVWDIAGKTAKSVGLEWAGDWKSFKEKCHVQYTGGLTYAEIASGKIPV